MVVMFRGANMEDGTLVMCTLRYADSVQNNMLRRNCIWNPISKVVKSALIESSFISPAVHKYIR